MKKRMDGRPGAQSERHARVAVRNDYACLAWIEGEMSGIARTLDLSSRGVGLVMARDVSIGSRCVVEVVLPGTLCIRASGLVRHVTAMGNEQFRIGLQFDIAPVLVDRAD